MSSASQTLLCCYNTGHVFFIYFLPFVRLEGQYDIMVHYVKYRPTRNIKVPWNFIGYKMQFKGIFFNIVFAYNMPKIVTQRLKVVLV